jgi:hypothetical protein
MEHPPLNTDHRTLREFGLVFAAGLVVFFGLLIPWISGKPWVWQESGARWPWIAALAFAGTGLLLPWVLKPVYLAWMKLGHALGWINTRIILAVVFFALFTPVSLLLRLMKRDPMHRQLDRGVSTYRQASTDLPRDRMERPF